MRTWIPYVILVESRRWAAVLRRLALSVVALFALLGLAQAAQGAPGAPHKIARDLSEGLWKQRAVDQGWGRDLGGVRYAKVLVVTDGSDPAMADLRRQVMAMGGSIYHRYLAVPAVLAMVPAAHVADLAARADVVSVSPNRRTARTASLLEAATGADAVRGAGGGVPGLDGTGVGIAVMDSGIATGHDNFLAADGRGSRVTHAVDLLRSGDNLGAG
ncbi:MAG TPA: hypothetical protein VF457_18785, partial [Burkholderiaceae bacterium]